MLRLNLIHVKGAAGGWFITLTHLPYSRIHASVNWVSVGIGNGLAPIQRQAIT